jgi:cation diffusion facilitator family transporter
MAAGGSTKVVVIALFANLGIAIAKFIASVATGSGAMLAEAIHSAADSGNQGLLLVGAKRAGRPPDLDHPLGYGREAYFWAMLVAVLLFSIGGLFSAYEGVHKLMHPTPIESPIWAVGVLTFGIFVEGYSLWAAWKECTVARQGMPLLRWARETGDVNLLVVTFEDLAAMAGLIIALAAVGLSWVTGNPVFDAAGTLVLGVLLLLVATFLGMQVRRLIAGSSVSPEAHATIRRIWDTAGFDVLSLVAVWSGPERIMVACKVRVRDPEATAAEVVERINRAEAEVKIALPRVAYHFVEPDTEV